MIWLLAALATAADCTPEATLPEALTTGLARADAAIAELDVSGLEAAHAELTHALQCQSQPVSPEVAAEIHRVEGIRAFVSGDEVAAAAWFGASRSLNGSAQLGHRIGGPLQASWERSLPGSAPARGPLPQPKSGQLVVDGTTQTTRPLHLPYVFQLTEGDVVTLSDLVSPSAEPPAYPTKGRLPAPIVATPRRSRTYAAGAGGSAVLAASLLTGAWLVRQQYISGDTSEEEAENLLLPNRVLGGTGLVAGAAAAGLGVAAVARWEW